jgi:hypothetical protein
VVEVAQEQLVAQQQAEQVVLVAQDCLPHTLEVLLLMQVAVAVVLGVINLVVLDQQVQEVQEAVVLVTSLVLEMLDQLILVVVEAAVLEVVVALRQVVLVVLVS